MVQVSNDRVQMPENGWRQRICLDDCVPTDVPTDTLKIVLRRTRTLLGANNFELYCSAVVSLYLPTSELRRCNVCRTLKYLLRLN